MKKLVPLLALIGLFACQPGGSQNPNQNMTDQTKLTNEKMKGYAFLDCMYQDQYFPKFLVDKCKYILVGLCHNIETQKPKNLAELYRLSQAATTRLNSLEDEFLDNDSEMETGARDCLGINFMAIAQAYGFAEADPEELIATRNW
jgi:hypothetical protein